MNNRTLKWGAAVACCIIVGVAQAQLGGLGALKKLGGSSDTADSAGGDITAQVAQFNDQAAVMRETVFYALMQVKVAFATKEEIAKAREQQSQIEKITDPKERASRQGSVIKEDAAAVQEKFKAADVDAKLKNMKPEMQKAVGDALLSVAIATLNAPDLLNRANGIIQSAASNPMNLTKVAPVKDGAVMLKEVAQNLPGLVSTGFKLMAKVNVNPGSPVAGATLKPNKETKFPDSDG